MPCYKMGLKIFSACSNVNFKQHQLKYVLMESFILYSKFKNGIIVHVVYIERVVVRWDFSSPFFIRTKLTPQQNFMLAQAYFDCFNIMKSALFAWKWSQYSFYILDAFIRYKSITICFHNNNNNSIFWIKLAVFCHDVMLLLW